MYIIYTINKYKILRKTDYIQRNLDDKRSARHKNKTNKKINKNFEQLNN